MKKFLIVLCVLAVCSITLAEEQNSRRTRQPRSPRTSIADSNVPAEEKIAQEQKALRCYQQISEVKKVEEQKKEEKPDYRSVIVDAWLVQVSADALYESGVKPFSEKDKENVSVMNLLWCLSDPNNGKIIVSATTRAVVRESAKNEFSNRVYLTDSTGRGFDYGQKVDFTTQSSIVENKQMRVWWKFNSDFIYSKIKDKWPPDQGSVGYGNITVVSARKPVIIAQTQIGDDMFFLVLRAEIVE